MNTATEPLERFRDLIEQAGPGLPGAQLKWLQQHRRQALAQFTESGFPTRKQEAWRYTSLDALLEQPFSVATELFTGLAHDDIAHLAICREPAARLVFCNGRFIEALSSTGSLPDGVRACSLRDMLQRSPGRVEAQLGAVYRSQSDVFAAINSALINDGLWLELDAGVRLGAPIELLSLAIETDAGLAISPRNLVVLHEDADATLIEQSTCLGPSHYFFNSVTEIALGPRAGLHHYRLQEQSPEAFHKDIVALQLDSASNYHGIGLSLGARWSRSDCRVAFTGEQASARVDGLYFADDKQLTDVHLDIEHTLPRCSSREHFKGILTGKGRAVFDGRVRVAVDAQKTDAHLKNDNLLLSRDAEIDTKPQLEIFADDVQCSHGTTVGQIEDQQLFYLRSRGIDETSARRMLCQGFATGILDDCSSAEFTACAEAAIARRL